MAFVVKQPYAYENVCKLLNWDKNINGQNIGGYKYDEATKTFPVLINYDEDPSIAASIQYEDHFVFPSKLIALSKSRRNLESADVKRLRSWSENDMKIYLFVRKNKDDKTAGKEFYFLGEMEPTGEYEQIAMAETGDSAVAIGYRLDVPVESDLHHCLTTDLGDALMCSSS